MAHITFEQTSDHGVIAAMRRFFTMFGAAMAAYGESQTRIRQIDVLNAKSVAELAGKGLKREDIVRHVFADLLHV